MYIGIPLLIVALALIGIAVIIARKFSYLQKLTPESHAFGANIFEDFFPELLSAIRAVRLREYFGKALIEVEKFLRKLRLIILSVERLSDALIRKIRRIHRKTELQKEERVMQEAQSQILQEGIGISNVRTKGKLLTADELKQEEQRLIVAIAQTPKDAALYYSLGEVYLKMKNYSDARDSFQAALKFDPENKSAAKKLSLVLDKLSKNGDTE